MLGAADSVVAVPYDARTLETSGEAIVLDTDRPVNGQSAAAGVLAFISAEFEAGYRFQLLDREGRVVRDLGPLGDYWMPRISHDGSRVAVEVHYQGAAVGDLEIFDLDAERPSLNVSLSPESHDAFPVWSPDDTRIMYDSTRGGGQDVFVKATDGLGAEEVALETDAATTPSDWSPDGRTVLVDVRGASYDIFHFDPDVDGTLPDLLGDRAQRDAAVFSPDARWVAYASDENQRFEIYIEPFPRGGSGAGKFRISTAGGEAPRFSADGRELFYLALDGGVMAVPISLGDTVQWGSPTLLFRSRIRTGAGVIRDSVNYDVAPDGQHFVAITSALGQEQINVIVNWPALLPSR